MSPDGVEAVPVQFDGRRWRLCAGFDGAAYGLFALLRRLVAHGRAWRRLSRARWKACPAKVWLLLAMFAGLIGSAVATAGAGLLRRVLPAPDAPPMRPGDVLLLPEYPLRRIASIESLRSRDVRVVAIIHDCVPLTHPQFYRQDREFARYFDWCLANAHGIMTVSAFSEHEIRARLPAGGPWTAHFHLGADFSIPSSGRPPRRELAAALGRTSFLMVGTIAPHKNHCQALDAMELRWRHGSGARLIIVGKVGWQADELLGRIARHPELGLRLFVFHDLDDGELAYAYSRSHALIAASYVEGFGLPVAEALCRGLPVVASDIPVFREIGGDSVDFFTLDDVDNLARALGRLESLPRRQVDAVRFRDWNESTRQLLEEVRLRLAA